MSRPALSLMSFGLGLGLALAAAAPCGGQAAAGDDDERLDRLERRLAELERERDEARKNADEARARADEAARRADAAAKKAEEAARKTGEPPGEGPRAPAFATWYRRLHLSGNADVAFLYGEQHSRAKDGRFVVDNARLFLDVDLGEDLRPGGVPVADLASAYVEWDIARHAAFLNRIGSLYVRLDGLGSLPALNLKMGRMAIPFGEEYTRWTEGRPANPFLGFTAAAPYGWDEGIELFGSLGERLFSYTVAVMDGDEAFGKNTHAEPAVVAKLSVRPREWLCFSVSGIRTGAFGDASVPARSALILSAGFVTPFGSGTEEYGADVRLPTDPDPKIQDLRGYEADIVLERPGMGRLWLGFGQLRIEAAGDGRFDRLLYYGVAEGVLELGLLAPALDRVYLAARYSVISTSDRDRGYEFNADDRGDDLGFNTHAVHIATGALGLKIVENVTFKVEGSWVHFGVIRSASAAVRELAAHRSIFAAGFSVGF